MNGVIVHDWIGRTGGAEKVLDAMVETFPGADILTLWNDDAERRYPNRSVTESWLARTPLRHSKAMALPFMPATWRGRKSAGYEWALVSSHLFAHHATFANQIPDFRKYVYVHTPARYIWNPELDERGNAPLPRLVSPALRLLDRKRAQDAYSLAANSEYVRQRIQRAWGRDAKVIHPPVDVARIQSVESWADKLSKSERFVLERVPRPFVLGASRFVPYKRLDSVIAAGEASGLPVVLAGSGPLRDELAARGDSATVPVFVVDRPSDELLYALYQEAMVYMFPAIEDFGIMPVEAMAAGTPVVITRTGGARESVNAGVTGAIAHLSDPKSLAKAIEVAAACHPFDCRIRARDFDVSRFGTDIKTWMKRPTEAIVAADV